MTAPYSCSRDDRRQAVAAGDENGEAVLNGIDFLEVAPEAQARLAIHFVHPLPGETGGVPQPPGPELSAANILIEGGTRIKGVHAVAVEAAGAVLNVLVNTPGDFSIYTLRLVQSRPDQTPVPPPGFDPALSRIEFSFKVACPTGFDCAAAPSPVAEAGTEPAINYLAKDYATFRRLMLDRLSVVMPDWKDRTPADMQLALVEMMAFVGDALSYYQDAVATEAYLGTARKRASVRRHARLLDYAIHEGSNARAWICLTVQRGSVADGAKVPAGTPLLTGGGTSAAVSPADADRVLAPEAPEVFETMDAVTLRAERNELRFYTWSGRNCWLPQGSTTATLVDPSDRAAGAPLLGAGDVLIVEEVASPTTGLARDADPTRRCAVRLKEEPIVTVDPLTNAPVIEIEWEEQDALPFPLCVSASVPDAAGRQTLVEPTRVMANVVLADHGTTVRGEPLVPDRAPDTGVYRPALARDRLTFRGPRDAASATAALDYDVREATPVIALDGDGGTWTAEYDLLASGPFSRHFVVEMQSDGVAVLRFGDGISGRAPSPGARLTATYRRGNGTRGNVGPETIRRIVWDRSGISSVRNPLAATGGRVPEALEEVRQFAPQAFGTQERAVTEADYAAIAERNAEVQKAAATFRWTGSWYTAFVTVDRTGGRAVDGPFRSDIATFLERYRMAGYDVEIGSPIFVPIDLALSVCVSPGVFRGDVELALREVFGARDLPDGRRGFFHPDNFTFGQSLYLSQIYRAAMDVAGIVAVDVTRFQRWGKAGNHELEKGVLAAAPLEILQLANDPNFPENGRLQLVVLGGL